MTRAQQNDIAIAAREQQNASENESPHKDFVEFGIPCYQGVQLLGIEFDEVSSFRDPPTSKGETIGNHGHLAGEGTGMMRCDGAFAHDSIGLHNVETSRKQHKEGEVSLARFEQNLAKFDLAYPTRLAKPCDLRGSENRKCLCL